MDKKVLQDIHDPKEGSVSDRPSRKWDYNNSDGIVGAQESSEQTNEDARETYRTTYYNGGAPQRGKGGGILGLSLKWWIGIGLIIALVLFVFVWSLFASATVRVVLSQQITSIDEPFSAMRVGETTGDVTYQIVKLEESATVPVQATGQEEVTRRATGEIVVYSEFGDTMRLIPNTRFETPDGKIYRVANAIEVPGATSGPDGELIPGELEISVSADQFGEEYNIEKTTFTVPGLKETELYDKFFARSKTDMSGGFDGVRSYASEEDIDRAVSNLRGEVRQKLLSSVEGSIGDDRVLYEDAMFVDFKTNIPTETNADGNLIIEEVGTLQAFVFDKRELSSAVAEKTLSSYDNSPVEVQNFSELSFSFENRADFDPNLDEEFAFTLSGNPHIVWQINNKSLKEDLAGLSEGEISSIINDHSSIRRIEADIKPFWKSSFPDNPEAIEIEEVLE